MSLTIFSDMVEIVSLVQILRFHPQIR